MEGNKRQYLVQRLKCPKCNRIHHELPDFIVPYKRYCVQIIEDAIDGKTDSLPCYDSTIQSFKRWFIGVADKMVLLLNEVKSATKDNPQSLSSLPLIKELYGATVGWLAWAVMQTVQGVFCIKTTRLRC